MQAQFATYLGARVLLPLLDVPQPELADVALRALAVLSFNGASLFPCILSYYLIYYEREKNHAMFHTAKTTSWGRNSCTLFVFLT